ncbi:MAG: NifU family protein [Acidimicrobiales bacterium]
MSADTAEATIDPTAFVEKVDKVIQVMRPAIQADEGDIFLRNADPDTGVVQVELVGACVTCPVSTATLKDGVERILKKRVDGVTSVEHVGAELNAETGTVVALPGGKTSPFAGER